jgi:hypothetical protein
MAIESTSLGMEEWNEEVGKRTLVLSSELKVDADAEILTSHITNPGATKNSNQLRR